MAKQSAGILLYRKADKGHEVLIIHPGGPFWAKRDKGAWSIPKGEYTDGEEPFVAAKREFAEEVGTEPSAASAAACHDLGEIKQPSGKVVHIFACESDFNLETFNSNLFEMEWPPKSGQRQQFPEADKAAWVSLAVARTKLVKGQVPFIDRLAQHLGLADVTNKKPDSPQISLF